MKNPVTIRLDPEAVGKILAQHQAQSFGLTGKWRVTFKCKDGELIETTVTVSEHVSSPT